MIRLSHSSVEKYLQCPKKWELHYRKKLRPDYTGSALFLGSALDEAFGRLLLDKKSSLTEEEAELKKHSAEDIFRENMNNIQINRKTLSLSETLPNLRFFKSDCDLSLLEARDRIEICEYAEFEIRPTELEQFVEEFQQMLKNKTQPEQVEQNVYNYICHYSLYRKGLLLIEAYRQEIIPKIHEVYEIQKKIEINDGDDLYMGYIDFTASFVDDPNTVYVIDNKTSSKPYKDDSVRKSQQLASYCEYMQTNSAAYIVVEKKLRKREPRVRTQIIRDTIPEETFDAVFDKISEVFYNIEENNFPMVKDQEGDKACFAFGQRCEFFDYCRNGSKKFLKNLGE